MRNARLWLLIWGVVTWVRGLCRARAGAEELGKHVWPEQTRRTGLRFTERIRDHFRPRWLRIHRPDDTSE